MFENRFAVAFVLFLPFFPSNLFADTALTEEIVRKTIDAMQAASEKQDADKVISYFSQSAKVVIDMPSNMGGKMSLSTSQYKAMLELGWALAAEGKYTVEVRDINISVQADGQSATVTDIVIETMEVGGQKISSKTYETITFKSEQGKPIVTNVYGKVEYHSQFEQIQPHHISHPWFPMPQPPFVEIWPLTPLS